MNANALTMSHSQYDICIVGAGLVGLSCLLALKQLAPNYRIAIIDPNLPRTPTGSQLSTTGNFSPSFDDRHTALSMSTVTFFKQLGLWTTLCQFAQPIKDIEISSKGQWGFCQLNSQKQQLQAFGYLVPNKLIGQSLLTLGLQQPQVDFFEDKVIGINATDDPNWRYQLQISKQSLQSKLTIICDGGRSNIKQLLGIRTQTQKYQSHAIISSVQTSMVHQGKAFERFHPQGPIALLPKQHPKQSALVWSTPEHLLEQRLQLPASEFLAQLETEFGRRLGKITKIGELHHYPLTLSRSQEQIRPGLLLLGNSAIALHPVAGQGFNLAIFAVKNLQNTLKNTPFDQLAEQATLLKYQQSVLPKQRLMQQFSHQLATQFSHTQPAIKLARSFALSKLDQNALLKHSFCQFAMGF